MDRLKLTPNAIQRIVENADDLINPLVQILQMKRMNPEDEDSPRFKLQITDGTAISLAMATHMAAKNCMPGKADCNSIIRLTNYQHNVVQGKKVIIILDFELETPGSVVKRSLHNAAAGSAPTTSLLKNGASTPAGGQVSTSRPQANGAANANAFKIVHPIESLTPYQNKWCIRARVTAKPAIRTYSNARGEGKLFSVELTDASGGIRATGFNAECDRLYDLLKEGQVFYIRGGQIKAANKQFSSLKNDYELTFSSETQVDACYDEVADKIPGQQFNLVPFNQLPNKPKDILFDVIGVVDSVSNLETLTSRATQKECKKRNIRLIDDTQCSVSLTIWGDDAENFDANLTPDNLHPLLAAKGVRINDFQGLSLSLSSGGKLIMDPDCEEAYKLRGWYDKVGSSISCQNLSSSTSAGSSGPNQFTLIGLTDAERLGTKEKPDYFTIKGTISAVKRDSCLYKACPTSECNKKLIEMGVDSYRCEKCTKEYSSFKWRLMLSAQFQDFSGQLWATCFEDTAQAILGYSAEELGEIKKRDEDSFAAAVNKCLFKTFAIRLRAKLETFNDETRVKFNGVKVDPIKYDEYIRFLQEDIKKLELQQAPTY